jgi:hypothetical protein
MKRRADHLYLGLAVGVLMPFFVYFLYYLYNYRFMTISTFIGHQKYNGLLLSNVRLCLIGNLAPFFLFIYTERMKSARGVLFSMFIWAILIAYLTYLV